LDIKGLLLAGPGILHDRPGASGLAIEQLQNLLKFMAQLVNDLVALGGVLLGAVTRELQPGTDDGETLFVEEAADLAHHEDIMALVVAAIAAAFDWVKLEEFLFPVTQHVRLDAT